MKNRFRENKINLKDVVVWSINNRPAIISKCNYKRRSGEQSMFKLIYLTKHDVLIETNWIPENQLIKI